MKLYRLPHLLHLFVFLFIIAVIQQQLSPSSTLAAPIIESIVQNLTLSVTAPEGALAWGATAELIATVTNSGTEPLSAVQITLPPNRALYYIGELAAPDAVIDTAILQMGDLDPGASTSAVISLQIRGVPQRGFAQLHLRAQAGPIRSEAAAVNIPIAPFAREETAVPASGTIFTANTGHVTIDFPPNWADADATLTYQTTAQYIIADDDPGLLFSFDVTASTLLLQLPRPPHFPSTPLSPSPSP